MCWSTAAKITFNLYVTQPGCYVWYEIRKRAFLQLGVGQRTYDLSGFGASDTITFHNPLALPTFGSLVDKIKVPGCDYQQDLRRCGGGPTLASAPCAATGTGVPRCPLGWRDAKSTATRKATWGRTSALVGDWG